MAEQPQESWWKRRKNAQEARKKSEAGVYETHPTWLEYRAQLKRYSRIAFPLAFIVIVASVRGLTREGLGFGADINARIGNNVITVCTFWLLLSLVLVRVFRSFALSSYSRDFRLEARNLMGRTSDPDSNKRWNTGQLVRHLARQLAQAPQDGVILVDIIQLEGYSLTALIDAAERSGEKDVLQAILKFQKLNAWMNSVLFVLSAVISGFASTAFLRLAGHFPGSNPMALIAAGFCVAALFILVMAFQKGLDPEKWITAIGFLFIGIALWLLINAGAINGADVVRSKLNIGVGEPKASPAASPSAPSK